MEKKSKEVKMRLEGKTSGTAVNGSGQQKLTYEQLEQIAGNLNQQCRVLQQQLMQAQNTIAEFNEIGMLLDVLKQSEQFSSQFIERCANKIEELITKALDESEKQQKAQAQDKN